MSSKDWRIISDDAYENDYSRSVREAKAREEAELWEDFDTDEDGNEIPFPDEYNHTGFTIKVDGIPAHVYGDPNMPAETMNALHEMVRAAIKYAALTNYLTADMRDEE